MYKDDLALNNIQWLICQSNQTQLNQTQLNQTKLNQIKLMNI